MTIIVDDYIERMQETARKQEAIGKNGGKIEEEMDLSSCFSLRN